MARLARAREPAPWCVGGAGAAVGRLRGRECEAAAKAAGLCRQLVPLREGRRPFLTWTARRKWPSLQSKAQNDTYDAACLGDELGLSMNVR
jgi:hypothetical protein